MINIIVERMVLITRIGFMKKHRTCRIPKPIIGKMLENNKSGNISQSKHEEEGAVL